MYPVAMTRSLVNIVSFALFCLPLLSAPAGAIKDSKLDFNRADTQTHFGLSMAGGAVGSGILQLNGVPRWRATTYSSLFMTVAGFLKEYGVDAFASGNDLQADMLGIGAGAGVQVFFAWRQAGKAGFDWEWDGLGGLPWRDTPKRAIPTLVQGEGGSTLPNGEGFDASLEDATERALRDSVFWVLRKHSPGVPAYRVMQAYDKRILRRYKDFIDSHEAVSDKREGYRRVVQVAAKVRADDVERSMRKHKLMRAGKHLELQALISGIRGGGSGTDGGPGSVTVENNPYSAALMGMGARYYWTDRFFTEGSILMLKKDVPIATVRDGAGNESPLLLTRYSPISLMSGYKWFDAKGFRASTSLGRSFTMIRGEVPDVPVPFPSGYYVQSWVLGADIQWIPLPWLGVGLRGDLRTKTRYDLITEKRAQRWLLAGQILIGF